MGKLMFASALMFVVGCGQVRPTSYSVVINGFNADQTADIVAGIDDWQAAVGDESALKFYVSIGAPCDLGHDDAICIAPSTVAELAKYGDDTWGYTDSREFGENKLQDTLDPQGAMILLATDVPGLKHTTEHEIGHALGLHHAERGTVMFKDYEARVDVTSHDVAQFWATR